jgi:hypothetical protein
MTAVAAARLALAAEGQPSCGERHPFDHLSCARLPGHPGGHLSRDRARYWQAGEPTP